ncbi:glucose-6-phosphate isomerase [Mucilaginibacter hurinus]|uniref:glucose-6-phosphate isomerase n=2 Tax=Mucilaginibacter hurinus TaxID=2201324 RepID=A0A367GLP6_9SPHI|nr:glucose-6-phosphate isomerase [Mucilaginibacter hurinus]
MNQLETIKENVQTYGLTDGICRGENLIYSEKTLAGLENIFVDEDKRKAMNQSEVVYRVEAYFPVAEGTEAGLFFGTSRINPGQVGDEYFMTQGHFHQKANRGEFYWGIKGEGVLLLMDMERNTRAEKVFPGSLHYIPGFTGHRLVNTGKEELTVGACWPSDAGHNYGDIREQGFSKGVFNRNGVPVLEDIEKR